MPHNAYFFLNATELPDDLANILRHGTDIETVEWLVRIPESPQIGSTNGIARVSKRRHDKTSLAPVLGKTVQ
jgi:hypothetical protein